MSEKRKLFKLFLSWMAIRQALAQGRVREEELDSCLFSTSVGELILAQGFDLQSFVLIFPHLEKAAREGRLCYYGSIERINGTTVEQLNEMLQRNGVSPLSRTGFGTLRRAQIDGAQVLAGQDTPLEVFYVDQPGVEEMRAARQQLASMDPSFFAGPQARCLSSWMVDLPVALAARG